MPEVRQMPSGFRPLGRSIRDLSPDAVRRRAANAAANLAEFGPRNPAGGTLRPPLMAPSGAPPGFIPPSDRPRPPDFGQPQSGVWQGLPYDPFEGFTGPKTPAEAGQTGRGAGQFLTPEFKQYLQDSGYSIDETPTTYDAGTNIYNPQGQQVSMTDPASVPAVGPWNPAGGMVDWTGPPGPATVGVPASPEGWLPPGQPPPPPPSFVGPLPTQVPGQALPGQTLPGQPLSGQPLPGQPLPSPAPSPAPFPDTNIPTIFGSSSVGGGSGGVVPALDSLRSLAMRGNTDLNSALYGSGSVGRSVPLMRNGGSMGFRPIGRMIG